MSSATEDHGHGLPDEIIVVGYAGAMAGLIAVLVGLAVLARLWTAQAEPDMRHVEPPAPVEVHH